MREFGIRTLGKVTYLRAVGEVRPATRPTRHSLLVRAAGTAEWWAATTAAADQPAPARAT